MSLAFSRSLQTIDGDTGRRNLLAFALVVSLLVLWGCWFTFGRLSVYAASASARLEVAREHHSVDAVVGGRIIAVPAVAGKRVTIDDPIAVLDASSERLAQNEEAARLGPAASQLILLREQLESQQRALNGERHSAEAAMGQNEADMRRARAAADSAADDARRLSELHARSLVSEREMLRARNLTTERQSEVEALGFAAGRIARELETREHDRLTQIARLKREIAQIEGTQAEARAATDRLANEVEQKVVRAPISGTIADLAPLRTGSVIVTGTRIATIVPDGDLKVVAFFRPSDALGRIHPGQKARIRLEGFPWTQYGSPTARVAAVAGEARDGTIRVDLTLDPGQPSEIPLQHGLPAEVSVEIEHISPVALVLRSIGAFTRVAAAGR